MNCVKFLEELWEQTDYGTCSLIFSATILGKQPDLGKIIHILENTKEIVFFRENPLHVAAEYLYFRSEYTPAKKLKNIQSAMQNKTSIYRRTICRKVLVNKKHTSFKVLSGDKQ